MDILSIYAHFTLGTFYWASLVREKPWICESSVLVTTGTTCGPQERRSYRSGYTIENIVFLPSHVPHPRLWNGKNRGQEKTQPAKLPRPIP
jgi:hypothetical protein